MDFDKQELAVLKILVDKELEHLEKDAENLHIVNSPFLNKMEDESDLDFLKSEMKYQEFLEKLAKKL